MKIYTYKEKNETLKTTFTQYLSEMIQEGATVEYVSSGYIRLDFGYLNLNNDKTSMQNNNFNTIKSLEFVNLSNYRNTAYVTREDYNDCIKPLRESRQAQKPKSSDYRKVDVIPDSLLNRIKQYDGFKKATKENVRIMRYENDLYINCGTKKVLHYEFSKWNETYTLGYAWLEKEDFESRYKTAQ